MTFASFLLVSALGVAAEPTVVQPAAPVASAPVAGAPVSSVPVASAPAPGCCTATTVLGHSHDHGLISKLSKPGLFSGLFSRHSSSSSCGCGTIAAPAPAPASCDPCSGGGLKLPRLGLFGGSKSDSCCSPAPAPTVSCDPCSSGIKAARPNWFGGFFGGHGKLSSSSCGCGSSTTTTVVPGPVYNGTPAPATLPSSNPPVAPTKKLPLEGEKKVDTTTQPPVITPAAAKSETGSTNPFDSDRRYDLRDANAADSNTLTGQLQYVHADGGTWVLRYATVSTEDANGGSVIISSDRRMIDYRDGDTVRITGQILDKRGSARLGAPLFQMAKITLVERPAR